MRTSTRPLTFVSPLLSAAVLLVTGCGDARDTGLYSGGCAGAGSCSGPLAEDGTSGGEAAGTTEQASESGSPPASGGSSGSEPDQDADLPGDGRGDSSSGGVEDDAPCGSDYLRCLEESGNLVECLPLYEDCGGGGNDTGSDGPDCCDELADACDQGGGADVCGGLQPVCDSGDCSQLPALCPPTSIPMSEPCQYAYLACHPGFVVNNCLRIPLESCLTFVGDAQFCEIRDVTCAERIAYCEDLVGFGSNYVACAEKGDVFDRCWDELDCALSSPSCTDAALFACTSGPGPLCASPLG